MASAADLGTGGVPTVTPASSLGHAPPPRVEHIQCPADGPAAQILASYLEIPVVRSSVSAACTLLVSVTCLQCCSACLRFLRFRNPRRSMRLLNNKFCKFCTFAVQCVVLVALLLVSGTASTCRNRLGNGARRFYEAPRAWPLICKIVCRALCIG